ncbi:MAG: GspH/FimT family protein [Armatimonadota bacterium]|nr:GspH/FimT family protein [Armatimonadota bacterium]
MIVAAIGLLVLSLSVGGISRAMAREELDGWAKAVAAELTAAQQQAMTRRTTVTVSFQNQTLTVVAVRAGTLRTQDLPAHISFGSTLQAVRFDRRGVPDGAATVTLTSARAGKTYTIRIQASTGRVTVNE